jgi:hypothetical protein
MWDLCFYFLFISILLIREYYIMRFYTFYSAAIVPAYKSKRGIITAKEIGKRRENFQA